MSSEIPEVPIRGERGCLRIVYTVCFAFNLCVLGLIAHLMWWVRPSFGLMYAKQNIPLPWITEALIQSPGWIHLIPLIVIAAILVANEFMIRRYGIRLLISALLLVFGCVYFFVFLAMLAAPI